MGVWTFTTFLVLAIVLLNGVHAKDLLNFRQGEPLNEDQRINRAFAVCILNWQPLVGEPCLNPKESVKEAANVVLNPNLTPAQKLEGVKKLTEKDCERPVVCGTDGTCECNSSTPDSCVFPHNLNKDCGNEFTPWLPVAERLFTKLGFRFDDGGKSSSTVKSSSSKIGPQFESIILTTVFLVHLC